MSVLSALRGRALRSRALRGRLTAAVAAAMVVGTAAACSSATEPATSGSALTSRFAAGLPAGWVGGSNPEGVFQVGTDVGVVHGGGRSASLRTLAGVVAPGQFAAFGQAVRADAFRGKRVRLRGWVRVQDVQTDGAGVWLRIDGLGVGLLLDNSDGRRLTGTLDWQQVQAVLDVPPDADALVFGGLMVGGGQSWFDDFTLDVVGADVPTTFAYTWPGSTDIATVTAMRIGYSRSPLAPVNLDFESTTAAARGPLAPLGAAAGRDARP